MIQEEEAPPVGAGRGEHTNSDEIIHQGAKPDDGGWLDGGRARGIPFLRGERRKARTPPPKPKPAPDGGEDWP